MGSNDRVGVSAWPEDLEGAHLAADAALVSRFTTYSICTRTTLRARLLTVPAFAQPTTGDRRARELQISALRRGPQPHRLRARTSMSPKLLMLQPSPQEQAHAVLWLGMIDLAKRGTSRAAHRPGAPDVLQAADVMAAGRDPDVAHPVAVQVAGTRHTIGEAAAGRCGADASGRPRRPSQLRGSTQRCG